MAADEGRFGHLLAPIRYFSSHYFHLFFCSHNTSTLLLPNPSKISLNRTLPVTHELTFPTSFSGPFKFSNILCSDLAKNWNIDIASELEDYLGELESITISFDGGLTRLNFAEAALLIQGSTCVYSKKVEYLYALLYKTLDVLIERQRKQSKQGSSIEAGSGRDLDVDPALEARGGSGRGGDSDAFTSGQFLDLDDVFERDEREGKSVDLVGSEATGRVDLVETHDMSEYARRRRATLLQRPPLSLLSDKSTSKDEEGLTFKISNCAMDANGALMLQDRQRGMMVGMQRKDLPFGSPHSVMRGQRPGVAQRAGSMVDMQLELDQEMTRAHQQQQQQNGMPAPIFGAGSARGTNDDSDDDDEDEGKRAFVDEEDEEDEVDPWAMMDPHDNGAAASKPFRKARTFRVPARVPVRAVSLAQFVEMDLSGTVEVMAENKAFFQYAPPAVAASASIQSASLPEFETLHRAALKRKREKRKQAAQARARGGAGQPLISSYAGDDADDDDDDDFVSGSTQYDMMMGDVDFGSDLPPPEMTSWDHSSSGAGFGAGFDMSTIDAAAVEREHEDLENEAFSSYESLCREHLDRYMQEAARFASSSEIVARVSDWQSKLAPILTEQEMRRPFDIHDYGNELLVTLTTVDDDAKDTDEQGRPVVSFTHAVQGVEGFEIARMFLATLQLANAGSVEIEPTEELVVIDKASGKVVPTHEMADVDDDSAITISSFRLHVTSSAAYRPETAGYLAPSVQEAAGGASSSSSSSSSAAAAAAAAASATPAVIPDEDVEMEVADVESENVVASVANIRQPDENTNEEEEEFDALHDRVSQSLVAATADDNKGASLARGILKQQSAYSPHLLNKNKRSKQAGERDASAARGQRRRSRRVSFNPEPSVKFMTPSPARHRARTDMEFELDDE